MDDYNLTQSDNNFVFLNPDYMDADAWNLLGLPANGRTHTQRDRSSRSRTSGSYVLVNGSSDPSIVNQSSDGSRYFGSHGSGDFHEPCSLSVPTCTDAAGVLANNNITTGVDFIGRVSQYENLISSLPDHSCAQDWDSIFSDLDRVEVSGNDRDPLIREINGLYPLGPTELLSLSATSTSALPVNAAVVNAGPLSRPLPPLLPKGKRKRYAPAERESVKRVRKVGACLRCKAYGEKCSDETPCQRCTDVSTTSRTFKQPCYRIDLDQVMTFRAGDSDQGKMRSDLPTLEWSRCGEIRNVHLRFPFDDTSIVSPILTIECREFVPKVRDILSETFVVEGKAMELVMPPYGCHNTESAQASMAEFVSSCQKLLLDEIIDSTMDELVKLSLAEATRYSKLHQDSIVTRALKIRTGAVLNSRYLALVNKQAFMPTTLSGDIPYYFEELPLPTMVSYVTQGLIAMQMIQEQSHIVKELKRKIFKGNAKQKNWYEVYLTVFVLLATVEYVYQKQKKYLGVKNGATTDSITNVKFISKQMLQEWEYSAQNLIKHFRVALRGMTPFSLDWEPKSGNVQRTGLDRQALTYVVKMKELLLQRKEEFDDLRAEGKMCAFDKPLVWIGELFHMGNDV